MSYDPDAVPRAHIVEALKKPGTPALTAVVLAAGTSQRMPAQNKLLLDFRGRPLVAHTIGTVVAAQLGEVIVVLGHEADRVRHALASYPVRCIQNDRYAEGMRTSIQAGVAAASPTALGYMICLADLPLIEPAELNALAGAATAAITRDPKSIIVPVHAGRRGNPVVFPAYYKPDILALRGVVGCRGLLKAHPEHVVAVEMETNHVLVDVDTPAAYAALQGR